jgi:hypothetical protein
MTRTHHPDKAEKYWHPWAAVSTCTRRMPGSGNSPLECLARIVCSRISWPWVERMRSPQRYERSRDARQPGEFVSRSAPSSCLSGAGNAIQRSEATITTDSSIRISSASRRRRAKEVMLEITRPTAGRACDARYRQASASRVEGVTKQPRLGYRMPPCS